MTELVVTWRVRPGKECRFCGEDRVERMARNGTERQTICRLCAAWKARLHRERLGKAEIARRRKRYRPAIRRHGLTTAEKIAWLDETGWKCFVCGDPFADVSEARVDHDHGCCPTSLGSCGKCRRGLLCGNCNSGIGMLRDDPALLEAAAAYLRRTSLSETEAA